MSLTYFTEKEIVKKRQPHKRKTSKISKEDSVERVFERFVDSKVKQNLRPKSLNQFLLMFNSIKAFHGTQNAQIFYMTDITTNFISDWVYWLKNEYVRFDGHAYVPESAQTIGLADETIASRIKRLKIFINWCLLQEIISKNPFNKFEGFRKDNTQIDILSIDELNNLLKVAKSYSNKSFKHFRDYVLLHLLIDGMFRITEANLNGNVICFCMMKDWTKLQTNIQMRGIPMVKKRVDFERVKMILLFVSVIVMMLIFAMTVWDDLFHKDDGNDKARKRTGGTTARTFKIDEI